MSGCHFLLQGIFLTQVLDPGLLICRQIHFGLSHLENLENTLEVINSRIIETEKWICDLEDRIVDMTAEKQVTEKE